MSLHKKNSLLEHSWLLPAEQWRMMHYDIFNWFLQSGHFESSRPRWVLSNKQTLVLLDSWALKLCGNKTQDKEVVIPHRDLCPYQHKTESRKLGMLGSCSELSITYIFWKQWDKCFIRYLSPLPFSQCPFCPMPPFFKMLYKL